MEVLSTIEYIKRFRTYWPLLIAVAAIVIVVYIFMTLKEMPLQPTPPSSTNTPPSVIATTSESASTTTLTISKPPLFHYIEIVNGCDPYYATGTCVNIRSGPGTEYSPVERLRTGIVLKVSKNTVPGTTDGRMWYKVVFDAEIRYPERVTSDWYIVADPEFVRPFENNGDENLTRGTPTTTKHIVVDLSEQTLYAYDGDTLFMKESVSTGLALTATPMGTFSVYRKTPSRYMQGPLPGVSDQYYDMPGVPWNLYFTDDGAVIHGAYWHDHFGKTWSHGCVNLPPQKAKELYEWAPLGISVVVQE